MTNIMKIAALAGAFLGARALIRQFSNYSFENKSVLITGGSRGLGLVLARQFAKEKSRLAITARDEGELERAQFDLQKRGATVLTVPCDVTSESQVAEMIDRVQSHYGGIDVLINNAGQIQTGPFDVMTREDFEKAINVHFWGPLNTILAVLPSMRERGDGRIVNISSIGGKVSVPHLLPYCASKFALVGLSEGLRAALLKDGIYVTTVCPGLMRTGSPRNADFKGQHRKEYAWFSISDALPLTSVSAELAAKQIVEACRRRKAGLVISLPAQLAVFFNSNLPGLTAELLAIANKVLPEPGGIGKRTAKGKESYSNWSPSWLTSLNEEAAMRNNEMG
jgi:short-subunit dehydrogenase